MERSCIIETDAYETAACCQQGSAAFFLYKVVYMVTWDTLNLNEPPLSFLLLPHYCGLTAGSIPLRAIVNQKQCETRGLFMSVVIHYWIRDVQDSQGLNRLQNDLYRVGWGVFNSTHSLVAFATVYWMFCVLVYMLNFLFSFNFFYFS